MDELLAENLELRKKIHQLESHLKLKQLSDGFGSKLHILSSEKNKLRIAGVLISEGVWKGIKYDYNELCKVIDKFKGIPILVMHGHTEEFKDRPVGRVIEVSKDDVLKALTFIGEITDSRAIELVKDGTYDAVSIKGAFETLDNSVTPPVGRGYTPIEVSLTGSPACETCYIFHIEELQKSLKECSSLGKGEVIPMSENNETFEIKPNELLLIDLSELSGEDAVEAKVVTVEELQEILKENEDVLALRVPAGRYPAVARRMVRIGKGYYPYYAYPYYYYYYYPSYYYPYYYPGYYGSPLDEIVDTLLEGDYREFMKKCLKEKGGGVEALKECALEWRQKQEESLEEELAKGKKVVCPVCGKEFPSKAKFLEHWKEEHEEKYGSYGQVKKLMRRLAEDPAFRRHLRKLIVSLQAEESSETQPSAEDKSEEAKVEEQPKAEPSAEPKQEEARGEEPKAESGEKPAEEGKSIAEVAREEKPMEERLREIKPTPELAAELLLKSLEDRFK